MVLKANFAKLVIGDLVLKVKLVLILMVLKVKFDCISIILSFKTLCPIKNHEILLSVLCEAVLRKVFM